MDARENYLRAVRFERPEYIPMGFHINSACWHHYPHDGLQELMATHPFLFPGFQRSPAPRVRQYGLCARKDEPYTDPWGCVWETAEDGIVGTVTRHRLASWEALEGFARPDPNTSDGRHAVDWDRVAERLANARAAGRLAAGGLPHGHTFLTLVNLRGYENLILDMADEEPRLWDLMGMLEQFNLAVVRRWTELGAEMISYPEDLGMQSGPMLSPEQFRKYIKPSYQRLMAPARRAGCIVHMHSDGDVRCLVDDLVEGGVEVINLQDLVNGIDWIRERLAGRVCIDLDIDRQRITRFGTPAEVDSLIDEETAKLGSREGGLMMIYGLYPGVPLGNVKALMDAMEKYAGRFS